MISAIDRKKILFFSSRLVSSQFHGSSHKVNASLTLGSTPILCWWLFRLLLITAASISSAAWVVLARYLFIIHTHDISHHFLQSFVHLIDTQMNILYSFKLKVIFGWSDPDFTLCAVIFRVHSRFSGSCHSCCSMVPFSGSWTRQFRKMWSSNRDRCLDQWGRWEKKFSADMGRSARLLRERSILDSKWRKRYSRQHIRKHCTDGGLVMRRQLDCWLKRR